MSATTKLAVAPLPCCYAFRVVAGCTDSSTLPLGPPSAPLSVSSALCHSSSGKVWVTIALGWMCPPISSDTADAHAALV
jgi:hypothetical protein